jgi:DNA-binding GntR family transcriptional regulator
MRRFLQVAEQIHQRIRDGVYPVGKRLPGRDRLAEEFGAGNNTMSQALAALAAEGVIEIRPQSGAYPLPPERRQPARWQVDIGTIRRHPRGYLMGAGTGDWEPIGNPEVVRVPCPADVAVLLADDLNPVDEGDEVVGRRRVVGPGYAVQLTTTYLAPRLVEVLPVVAAVDTGPGGWIERVEAEFDTPVHAEWFALSRPPVADEVKLFELPAGAPVLQVRRLISTAQGKPYAVDVVVWDARRVELVGTMRRDTSAEWPVPPASMRNSPGE